MELSRSDFDALTKLIHEDQTAVHPTLSAGLVDEWFSERNGWRKGYNSSI